MQQCSSPPVPQPQRPESVRWGPNYLADLSVLFCQRLSSWDTSLAHALQRLRYAFPDGLSWGSGCSGTDSPAWVFAALQNAVYRFSETHVCFPHVMSAECDKRKQVFLRCVAEPSMLFADIFDLSAASAQDIISGTQIRPADHFRDIPFFIAGFVCKSVSALNKGAATGAIWDEMCSTGSTLWAVLLFCQRMRPRVVVLENVAGLKRGQQHVAVCDRVRQLGYWVAWTETSPVSWGFPHDRQRLYFLAVRNDIAQAAGFLGEEAFQQYIRRALETMAQDAPQIPLDDVLFSERHDYILGMKAEERRQAKQLRHPDEAHLGSRKRLLRRASSTGSEPRAWVVKHRQHATACASTAWRDEYSDTYPAYLLLSPRIQDLLDIMQCGFPDSRIGVWNLSQSDAIPRANVCPCITPNAIMWLPHRGRRLCGREALCLQGLWVSNWNAIAECTSDKLLFELAGNAFNTVSALPIVLLGLVVLSKACDSAALAARSMSGGGSSTPPGTTKRSPPPAAASTIR